MADVEFNDLHEVWTDGALGTQRKLRLYEGLLLQIVLYGCEARKWVRGPACIALRTASACLHGHKNLVGGGWSEFWPESQDKVS